MSIIKTTMRFRHPCPNCGSKRHPFVQGFHLCRRCGTRWRMEIQFIFAPPIRPRRLRKRKHFYCITYYCFLDDLGKTIMSKGLRTHAFNKRNAIDKSIQEVKKGLSRRILVLRTDCIKDKAQTN